MSTSAEPRIVTAEEAQAYERDLRVPVVVADLIHTVATEDDRTRAAVVKTLREAERRMFGTTDGELIDGDEVLPVGELRRLLWLSFENGADW